MRMRISGPGPKGGIDRLEDTVKEVTNWDGLSMVRTSFFTWEGLSVERAMEWRHG